MFQKTGNSAANSIWEELAADTGAKKPTPDAERINKEQWIRRKYINKDFIRLDIPVLESKSAPLVLQVLRAVASGAEDAISHVLHQAQAQHDSTALKLLSLNGIEESLDAAEEPQRDSNKVCAPSKNEDQEDNNAMLDEFVTVKYRFMGIEDEDLPIITPGDQIRVVSKDESGWWRGELQGRVGLFPANYTSAEVV